ncbi:succinyl-diaminopimelate desuccinylase [Alishewanella longhuensis]
MTSRFDPRSNATLALTMALIEKPSVTPEDAGCQHLMATRLARVGFNIEMLPFHDTLNMWARHGQRKTPVLFCRAYRRGAHQRSS